MKFEGIEIALEGTGMKTTAENRRAGEGKEKSADFQRLSSYQYLLAQFQFLRISYSLKSSAEERGSQESLLLWRVRIRHAKNAFGLCTH